jgi:tetraacyldisaccharide 4'-kinase
MLLPVAWVFGALVKLRHYLYRHQWLKAEHPGKPVVVVGNVIAGGAGKTPVVIALTRHLQMRGLRPGIISRGYGRTTNDCREAHSNSPIHLVGDEPALLARTCKVPVFVAPKRIDAARALLQAYPETDVLLCDDGLQHLALARDMEICVFNSSGIGNGWMLPAGPLREPWPRPVHAVLHAGPPPGGPAPHYVLKRTLAPQACNAHGQRIDLAQLQGQALHALAGVARPDDFFAMLRAQGLTLHQTTALPDHYDFDSFKINTELRQLLICTEKDAIKLWHHHPEAWAVGLELEIEAPFYQALDTQLAQWSLAP